MSYKKIIIILLITLLIISFIFIFKIRSKTGYATYDKDGNSLEDIEYNPKDINIILVVSNTLRAKNLGIYGYERDTTPNIDKFSEEGVLFKQAYAPWTKTTPSLVSILTGQYPHTTRVMRKSSQVFPEKLTSIAEILQKNGYKTLGIASNPNTGSVNNFDQGFDEFIDVPQEDVVGKITAGTRHTEKETQKAIELLTEYKDDKFFLYLHYLDPHGPYNPPEQYKSKYIKDSYFFKYNKYLPITDRSILGVIPKYQGLKNITFVDFYISQYDSEVNYVDHNFGILLNKIKELELDKDTLIIFMSDHGSSLGEHDYWFEHGVFAYDACAHVPLIISYPDLFPKNKVIDDPTSVINVIPTILDIVNIPLSKDMEGKSLLPLILKDEKIDEYVYGEGGQNNRFIVTIRNQKWKLINSGYFSLKDEELYTHYMVVYKMTIEGKTIYSKSINIPIYELYDIENDPDETINLIDEKPEIAKELKIKLKQWIEINKPFGKNHEELSKNNNNNYDAETIKKLKALGYLT